MNDFTPEIRSRAEIEHDVLVALVTIEPFRLRSIRSLRPTDFAASRDHVELFRALRQVSRRPGQLAAQDIDGFVARVLGWSPQRALAWRMAASPITYDSDVAAIRGQR